MEPKIFDISVPISSEITVWPGDPKVDLRQVASIATGDESNISQIRMGVHTGTHIDAPMHFLDDGKTIEQIDLDKLIGPVLVMEFEQDVTILTAETIKKHRLFGDLLQAKKILFKTRNSQLWLAGNNKFQEDYVGLDRTAAQFLADLDIDLVGVDYLSIAAFKETAEPHQILLEKEVVLLEGIDLTDVPEGQFEIYCLPLLLNGCEGAPARVILIAR